LDALAHTTQRDKVLSVSVIIPTYNAEEELPVLLNALQQQNHPFELLIIDSSSTDSTPAIAKKYADIFLQIPKETFDHGGTRTLAAQQASGDILLFLTQDAVPADEQTIDTLVHVLNDPSVAAAYGRQIPHPDTSLFGKHLRYFNYPEESYTREMSDHARYGIKTAFFSDSFSAYKRSALAEAGWFKEGLIVGEDMHVAARLLQAGYHIAYCADARVYHAHSYTLTEEFRRYFDTGVFHRQEQWLLETFGKAEGEGKRYIRSELRYLLAQKAYLRLPEFMLRNLLKYTGYKLGQHYETLPDHVIKICTMHPAWWEKPPIGK
jgi:rhamnosyltransferase